MSPVYRIEPSMKFLFKGVVITFKSKTEGQDRPYIFEGEDGHPLTLSYDEIGRARADNTMRDWTPPSTALVRCG